jgi:hypothetical protein
MRDRTWVRRVTSEHITPAVNDAGGGRYRFRWNEVEQQLREHGCRPPDEDASG